MTCIGAELVPRLWYYAPVSGMGIDSKQQGPCYQGTAKRIPIF